MNVYLWANEIDPQILSGIYKGGDTVWTPAPSTLTFTYWPVTTSASYEAELNNWYWTGSISDICGTVNYILTWSDWYLYCAYWYSINWSNYYLECMKLSPQMNVIMHNQISVGDSTWAWCSNYTFHNNDPYWQYINTWKEKVDSSIVDFQTLWEWIYNNLQ